MLLDMFCGTQLAGTGATAPLAWRNRATEERTSVGWEMGVRIEKILCTVLDEAHKQQVEETTETLSEGPEELYRSCLD